MKQTQLSVTMVIGQLHDIQTFCNDVLGHSVGELTNAGDKACHRSVKRIGIRPHVSSQGRLRINMLLMTKDPEYGPEPINTWFDDHPALIFNQLVTDGAQGSLVSLNPSFQPMSIDVPSEIVRQAYNAIGQDGYSDIQDIMERISDVLAATVSSMSDEDIAAIVSLDDKPFRTQAIKQILKQH